MMEKISGWWAPVVVLCVAPSQAALGQSVQSSTTGETVAPEAARSLTDLALVVEEGPEVIVVTAQKRQENLQEIPLAVTVLTGEDIAQSYSNTIESLQMLVPTLTFRKGTTTRNSALTLRGVGTISFSIAAEPSVSTVVDGVVMARSGQAFADLYDLDQIEVLRGPQGTLFGKNASAGVINITTKGGAETFESRFSATAFEGEEYRFKGSVAGPLASGLTGRITGFFGTFSGNITNLNDDAKINGYNRYGARGVVEWNDFHGVRLKLIGDYYKGNDDCCAEVTGVSITSADGIRRDAIRGVNLDGINTRSVNHDLVTRTIDETFGVSLTGEFDIGDHTLTAIAAFRRWDNTEIRDGDFLPAVFVGLTDVPDAPFGVAQLHDRGTQEFNQFSAELRLASPPRGVFGFFDYVAGLYAWRATSNREFTRDDVVCEASMLPIDMDVNARPCFEGASTFAFPTSTAELTSGFTNFGVFGQGNIHMADDLRAVVGVRYIYDSVEYTHDRPASPVVGPGVRDVSNNLEGSADDHDFAAKLALQYDLFDGVMAYASYARGYKGPAFNVFYNMGPGDAAPVSEETSNSFELGVRSDLLRRLLRLNITGYFARYNDFQANNFVDIGGATTTTLANAGDIQTFGAEVDLMAFPARWLTLVGGLALTRATIDEFRTDPNDPNQTDDRSGDPLPLAPDVKFSISADVVVPITLGELELLGSIRSQFSYTSEQFSDIGSDASTPTRWPIDAYALWHGSVGVSDVAEQYRLTFIVRNILDQSFVTLNTDAGQRLHIPRDADRYFGFNFTTMTL